MKIKYTGENCVIGHENDGTPIQIKDYHIALMKMMSDVLEVLDKSELAYFMDGGTLLGAARHQNIIPWDDDIDLCFLYDDYPKIVESLLNGLDKTKYYVQCFDTDNNYDVTQPLIKIRMKNTYVDYDKFYAKTHCEEKGIFLDLIPIAPVPIGKFINFRYRGMAYARTLFLLFFNMIGINVKWLKKYHIKCGESFAKKGKDSGIMGYTIQFIAWENCTWKTNDLFPLTKLKYGEFMVSAPKEWDKYLRAYYGNYMEYPNLDSVDLLHSTNLRLKSGDIINK